MCVSADVEADGFYVALVTLVLPLFSLPFSGIAAIQVYF